MQSNNPILTRVETVSDYSQPMTVQGAIQKSVMLTIIAAAVGVALFFYAAFTANVGIAYAASIVGAIGGLVFKSVVISASLAIFIVFIVQMVMRLAFGSSIPYIFESNWLGISFAAFVAVIASLNLILDFDLIETNAAYRAPKFMEWLCGIALLATLVWMYISFLRLLGLLSDD